jgi:hypothetical protein
VIQKTKKPVEPKMEIIHIRCSPETKKLWVITLYEFKKKGWNADLVLAYALKSLLEKEKFFTPGIQF